ASPAGCRTDSCTTLRADANAGSARTPAILESVEPAETQSCRASSDATCAGSHVAAVRGFANVGTVPRAVAGRDAIDARFRGPGNDAWRSDSEGSNASPFEGAGSRLGGA